jgi:hypothetical protein
MGNGAAPNPDGWGLLLGASVFRRVDFSTSIAGIPELFFGYDLQSITWHSTTVDAKSANRSLGQTTKYDHNIRLFLGPYVGYEAGFAIGANLGGIF